MNTLAALAASPGTLRQGEIFIGGMLQQQLPSVPSGQTLLEERARAIMSEAAFAYVAGGAGRESTMRHNLEAFDRYRIVPRVLRDVGSRDMSIELLGQHRPHPILAAPIGVQELAHKDADLATARACRGLSVPLVISNQASHPMEAIASSMGDAARWFQLYWGKSDALVASLVQRAEASGCEAIVVTLDTAMLGWRSRDLDLSYLPFLEAKGIAQYTSDPAFRAMLDPENNDPRAASLLFMATYSNPTITWEKLAFLRQHCKLPILLKGILHPDDADLAVTAGMDGIIVSNHGGRQVDGATGALDALKGVVDRVAGRIPVLFDSGIRGGADIFKALCLGATAVCIGRPYVYGLAIAGEAGVRAVFQNLLAELDLTMGLAGCKSLDEVNTSLLQSFP